MRRWKYFLFAGMILCANAGFSQSTSQGSNISRTGYVVCTGEKNAGPVQIYEHPCRPAVGKLECGQSVELVARKGPFFRIKTSDGSERYVGATSVSQSKERFIPIDLPFAPWPNLEDCSGFQGKQPDTHRPVPLYSPNPGYTDKARKAKISGSVTLSFTVGTDGKAHDILVVKSLGYGLDENAVTAVQQWKFDPAAKDGKPIAAPMVIEVDFKQ
jgi:TonB family protein